MPYNNKFRRNSTGNSPDPAGILAEFGRISGISIPSTGTVM
jgi:hypothetical protein